MNSVKESKSCRYRVVMLPWLAHGHISPFLELAKRLTKHNFDIYFCSTPINLQNIKKNVADFEWLQLVELNLPVSPDLPPDYHTTNGLPPHLMDTLKDAYDKSCPDFTAILHNLKPHLLIYDFNQWWAADAASSLSIPSVQFLIFTAVSVSWLFHCLTRPSAEQYPFPEINLKDEVSLEDLKKNDVFLKSTPRSCGIVLIRTTRELEGKYIDYLSQVIEKKVLCVGPLLQESSQEDGNDDIFRWLDKKKDSSVVFLSFGSEYFLSENEIEDLAYGLEVSNVSFIWVIRFPKGSKKSVEKVLPLGFLERIGGKGIVMEKWAPQAKILSHSSIGGFISHCGWSSIMESIRCGVPIIAMPMEHDQPFNAKLVVSVGVGMGVGRGGDGRLKREEMVEVIRNVVVEEGGGRMRKKIQQLRETMTKKGDQDGDKVVIENLVKLCEPLNTWGRS